MTVVMTKGKAILAVTAALLVACGTEGAEQVGRDYLTAAEATTQYRAEAKKWALAPGWTWPTPPYPGVGPDGSPAVYGLDIGRVDATLYWFCSWGRLLSGATSSTVDTNSALRNVLRVDETAFYRVGLLTPDRDAFDRDVTTPARAGDLSGLATFVDDTCPATGT
jgi:hypothetical protein